jgi:hypothetical protein
MDEKLFSKYKKAIEEQKNTKTEILVYIETTTGVVLGEDEIIITKNTIKITTSSAKRSKLLQKNIYKHLKDKNISVTL